MTCSVCGVPCVPMADYDVPVCLRCDAVMEAITAVGPMPVVGVELEHGTHAAYQRHRRAGTDVCHPCVLAERHYRKRLYHQRQARLRAALLAEGAAS